MSRGGLLLAMVCVFALLVPTAAADTVGVPIAVPVTEFDAVACGAATRCEAVGFSNRVGGVIVPIASGVPGAGAGVPGVFEFFGVECQDATSCLAVGEGVEVPVPGVVVSITDGTFGVPITVPDVNGLGGVACESATSCVAVGSGYGATSGVVVPITDGTPGAAIAVPGVTALNAVTCPSATGCEAVGSNGSGTAMVVPITGGIPGSAIAVPQASELQSVACQTVTSCVAVGSTDSNRGVVVPITGGTPGSAHVVSQFELLGVACTAARCEAVGVGGLVGQRGVVVPIEGGVPAAPIPVAGTFYLNQVTCPSVTGCEAVGGTRYQGVVLAISMLTVTLRGHVTSRGASVTHKLRCQGAAGQSCRIIVQLTNRRAVVGTTKTIAVNTGRTTTVTVELNRTGRRLLKRFGKLPVTLTVSLVQWGGRLVAVERKLVLRSLP